MFQVGDYLVYKRDVCIVDEIKENYMNGLDYFVLIPERDSSLKIQIPKDSSFIRKLITKKDVEKIIQEIPNIGVIEAEDKLLEQEYKKLLNSGLHEDLIKVIKTTYLRNKKRVENKKKIGDKDNFYLEQAENDLYGEFGRVLGLSLEETKEYVIDKVEKLT